MYRKHLPRLSDWIWKYSAIISSIIIMWATFTDSIYQTMLAPILPDLLFKIEHPNWPNETMASNSPDILGAQMTIVDKMRIDAEQKENTMIGMILSTKAIFQIMASPFVGHFTVCLGYNRTIILGCLFLVLSSATFSFGYRYWALLLSKAIHGIGSSCLRIAGFGMIANKYTNDRTRETILGFILGSVIIGEVFGLLLGGFAFNIIGQFKTFSIISVFSLIGGLLQLPLVQLNKTYGVTLKENFVGGSSSSTINRLLKDPFILVVAGCTFLGNIQFSMLQASLPLRMEQAMNAPSWETGVVLLPQCISYFIGVLLFPTFCQGLRRWTAMKLAMIITMLAFLMIAFTNNFFFLLFPVLLCGTASALSDVNSLSELGFLADLRHNSVYAKVCSISEFATWLGYAVGPALGGILINAVGFEGIMIGAALLCLCYIGLLHITDRRFSSTENEALLRT